MYRITYVSDAHPRFNEDHLDGLLAASRRHNAAHGLTGLLVLHERSFFQVLEGPRAEVLQCYDRIAADWRHRDLRVLDRGRAERRVFRDWSMGSLTMSDLAPAAQDWLLDLGRHFPPGQPMGQPQAEVARNLLRFLSMFEDGRAMGVA